MTATTCPNCVHCADTGSLSKDIDGHLDCGHCTVAQERDALERWVLRNAKHCDDFSAAWLIYQHGKAAAAARTNKSTAGGAGQNEERELCRIFRTRSCQQFSVSKTGK